ncbi:hypothetical protein GPECTOR_6g844 [Gonium pectorale]|uniref:Uncharacterized protein n=1 Tax=Gonium pectorale TaxID=33097 RepID=A0A150GVL9_GONPE|nr:hypothetical protein GPECTOR_6g844 [Gonium pectorale]|eukprot:KXZ53926.1 hypothetical protein GPECTOR_6g844 [Gonium pectorale]
MSLDGSGDGQRLEVALDDHDDTEPLPPAHFGGGGDGPAALAAEGVGGPAGAGGEQEAEAGPITDTLASGLVGMQQRRASIEQQIDELSAVAVEFLEAMKKDFLERMARLKAEVGGYCAGQEGVWRETNAMTQEALGRLGAARTLVHKLGLNATGAAGGGQMQGSGDGGEASGPALGGPEGGGGLGL